MGNITETGHFEKLAKIEEKQMSYNDMIMDEHYLKKAQEEIRRAIHIENILKKKEVVINKLNAMITRNEKQLDGRIGDEMVDLTNWTTENKEEIIDEINKKVNIPLISEAKEEDILNSLFDGLMEILEGILAKKK